MVREYLEYGHHVYHNSPAMTNYTISDKFIPSTELFLSDYYVTNILDDGDREVLNIYKYMCIYLHILNIILNIHIHIFFLMSFWNLEWSQAVQMDWTVYLSLMAYRPNFPTST